MAAVLGMAIAVLPLSGNDASDDTSLNTILKAVFVAVAMVVGAWLAPRLIGASTAVALRTALVFLIVAVLGGAVLAALFMTILNLTDTSVGLAVLLVPVALTLVGLVLLGPAFALIGVPATVLWALLVRWLLRITASHDIRER